MIQPPLQPIRVEALVLQQVKQDAGIKAARTRPHHDPVERGKAHAGVDAAQAGERTQAGAATQMSDHNPLALGTVLRCGEPGDDRLVGQAVKPVPPHASVVPLRAGSQSG